VPLLDIRPVKPVGESSAPVDTDTTHAYTLFQQKQYAAAAKEARQIANLDPQNAEAWKLAGFSELALKQYSEASTDLQKALELQRVAKQEDAPTIDALAQAYVFAEKFDQALPLLVNATTRAGRAARRVDALSIVDCRSIRPGKSRMRAYLQRRRQTQSQGLELSLLSGPDCPDQKRSRRSDCGPESRHRK